MLSHNQSILASFRVIVWESKVHGPTDFTASDKSSMKTSRNLQTVMEWGRLGLAVEGGVEWGVVEARLEGEQATE